MGGNSTGVWSANIICKPWKSIEFQTTHLAPLNVQAYAAMSRSYHIRKLERHFGVGFPRASGVHRFTVREGRARGEAHVGRGGGWAVEGVWWGRAGEQEDTGPPQTPGPQDNASRAHNFARTTRHARHGHGTRNSTSRLGTPNLRYGNSITTTQKTLSSSTPQSINFYAGVASTRIIWGHLR